MVIKILFSSSASDHGTTFYSSVMQLQEALVCLQTIDCYLTRFTFSTSHIDYHVNIAESINYSQFTLHLAQAAKKSD